MRKAHLAKETERVQRAQEAFVGFIKETQEDDSSEKRIHLLPQRQYANDFDSFFWILKRTLRHKEVSINVSLRLLISISVAHGVFVLFFFDDRPSYASTSLTG